MKSTRRTSTPFFVITICIAILMQFILIPAYSQAVSIIPLPSSVQLTKGSFRLDRKVKVLFSTDSVMPVANYLVASLRDRHQLTVAMGKQGSGSKQPVILMQLVSRPGTNEERYTLDVTSTAITIRASGLPGLFYGVQSLLQLIPLNGSLVVPGVKITDEPRFGWRGLMLDVSRHFFSVKDVKRMIDEMVNYKFNLLHLHLTDDQGWRLQIKSLPELTNTGAWRVSRSGLWWDRDCPKEGEKADYGGFYTQEEVKDLIAYAAARYVDILPEIDVPGHSLAAIASYPELSSSGLHYKVNPGCKFYGIDDNSLCAGKESTYAFMDKVLTEVADLFPFEYIHIGGDECYKGFWEKCPDCQKKMKENGLKDVNELQSYFIRRMEKILQAKGKKLMGWDEILEGGLAPNATVMSWRGMQGGINAAKQNHHVVMSPNSFAYLDLYQGDPAVEPPTYSMLRLKKVYEFEPVPDSIDARFILGGQGNLWTESVPTFRHAEYMLWPRSFALAEVLWSPKPSRNWRDFLARTETGVKRLSALDINHAESYKDAIIIPTKGSKGELLVALDSEVEGVQFYYSFDNTNPDHHSSLYRKGEKLVPLTDSETFRVITYRDGKPYGKMIKVSLKDLAKE